MWQSPWTVVAAVFVAVGVVILVYFTAFDSSGSGGRRATPAHVTSTSTQTVPTTTQQATTATTQQTTTQETTTEQETTTVATTETMPATTTSTTTTTTATTTEPVPTVPDVAGRQMSAAARRIESAGYYADTAPVPGKSVTRGTVTAQKPRAGVKLAPGNAVRLAVSIGRGKLPAARIPDVVGKSAGAARAKLLASKLTVATKFKSAGASKAGKVIAQSPVFGTFRQYVQVTILVGK